MNSRSVEARSVDHHQHNLGKENQQGDSHHIGRHEPRSSPDNRLDSHILLQPLDYEEAYPHRRGDGAKSGYDGDEDGEPDQVISQRGGQRKEHWNAEGQETQSIREHTTHQVDQDDYQQYPHVRHIEPHYPLSESHRKSRIVRNPPRTTAPATRNMTMAETCKVSRTPSQKSCHPKRRRIKAIANAPQEPAAPASVGVNHPAYMPPKTREKRMTVSTTPPRARNLSFHVDRSPAGPSWGLRRHSTHMVAMNREDRIRPGITAPRKSLAIDCSACNAITMSTTLGGMTTPRVPPTATLPVLRASSYSYSSIKGREIVPMVAAVAELEPEMAAKPVLPTITVPATPPRMRPNHRYAASNTSLATPARKVIFPSSTTR